MSNNRIQHISTSTTSSLQSPMNIPQTNLYCLVTYRLNSLQDGTLSISPAPLIGPLVYGIFMLRYRSIHLFSHQFCYHSSVPHKSALAQKKGEQFQLGLFLFILTLLPIPIPVPLYHTPGPSIEHEGFRGGERYQRYRLVSGQFYYICCCYS